MSEDEVGDFSGVAEDVVLDLQVVEGVVDLSADVLAIGGIAGARASRTELSGGWRWIWGEVELGVRSILNDLKYTSRASYYGFMPPLPCCSSTLSSARNR